MIKDGADRVAPDCHGWVPIKDIALATGHWCADADGLDVIAEPMVIEGVTTFGKIVLARYYADGSYRDTWTSMTGDIVYRLTHARLIR